MTSSTKRTLTHPGFYAIVGLSLLMGLAGGIITLAFIRTLEWLQHFLWQTFPGYFGASQDTAWYVLVACLAGGALLGLAIKYLGNYPISLEEALEEFKKSKSFDYKHIWQAAVISLVSLGFGAALGPEAALTAIVGGIATWIGLRIKTGVQNTLDLNYISVAGVLGALFGTPVGSAAIPLEAESDKVRVSRPWLIVPGLVSALAAWWIFSLSSNGTSYFHYNFLPYDFAFVDIAWGLLAACAGLAVGLLFLYSGNILGKLLKPFAKSHVLRSTLGGLGLALLIIFVPLTIFSGHEGIQTIIDDYAVTGGLALLVAALAKLLAANLCLVTGWKGGRFFPIMFAGAAAGLGLTHFITQIPSMVGLAAGLSAALAVLLRKPLVAAIFAMFFFPPALYAVVITSAVLGSSLASRLPKANF